MPDQSVSLVGRSLFLAIPAYDGKIAVSTAFGVAQLATMLPQYGVGFEMAHVCGCSVVSKARNTLTSHFLMSNCTDMMFIDSDVKFNPQDVIKLLAHAKPGRDIMGGVIPTRKPNAPYIATLMDTDGVYRVDDGLIEAKNLGTAFMLIRREVIETLRDRHPEWKYKNPIEGTEDYSIFDFLSTPDGYIGEDYNFSNRARAEGFRIFIDVDIKLTHYGVWEFQGDFNKDVIQKIFVKQAADGAALKVEQEMAA